MSNINQINVFQILREALDRWRSYEEPRHCNCSDSGERFNPIDHYSGESLVIQNGSGLFSLNKVIELYDLLSIFLLNDSKLQSLWDFVATRVNSIRQKAYWFTQIEGFVKELFEIIKQLVSDQGLRFSSQASQSLFVSVATGFLSKYDESIDQVCDKLPFLWMSDSYENHCGVYYRTKVWVFSYGVSEISL